VKIWPYKENLVLIAYKASSLAKDARQHMDDFDYRAKAVDELAILFPIVFEGSFFF
jgi:hypothetical protein